MSIDIGTVSPERMDHRAQLLWRQSPEKAFSGQELFSIESSGDMDRSTAIASLAGECPERFVELTSCLTPLIQDIFLQHYLLGRTFAQIGALLFPDNNQYGQPQAVKIGNQLGLRALCAFIKCRGRIKGLGKRSESAQAWRDMQSWNPRAKRKSVSVRAARDLGDFVIHPNGQLDELFTLGPESRRRFGG